MAGKGGGYLNRMALGGRSRWVGKRVFALFASALMLTSLVPQSALAQVAPVPVPLPEGIAVFDVRVEETIESAYHDNGSIANKTLVGRIFVNNTHNRTFSNVVLKLNNTFAVGLSIDNTITVPQLPPGESEVFRYTTSASPRLVLSREYRSVTYQAVVDELVEQETDIGEKMIIRSLHGGPGRVLWGQDNLLVFNITVSNIGRENLTNVTVFDLVANETVNASLAAVYTTALGSNPFRGALVYDPSIDGLNIPFLQAGTSVTLSLNTTLPKEAMGSPDDDFLELHHRPRAFYSVEVVATQELRTGRTPEQQIRFSATVVQQLADRQEQNVHDTDPTEPFEVLAAIKDGESLPDKLLQTAFERARNLGIPVDTNATFAAELEKQVRQRVGEVLGPLNAAVNYTRTRVEAFVDRFAEQEALTARANRTTASVLSSLGIQLTRNDRERALQNLSDRGFPPELVREYRNRSLDDAQIESLRLSILERGEAMLNSTLEDGFRKLEKAYRDASKGYADLNVAALENAVRLRLDFNLTINSSPQGTARMAELKAQFKAALSAGDYATAQSASQSLADWAWEASLRTGEWSFVDIYRSALDGKIVTRLALAGDVDGATKKAAELSLDPTNYLFDDPPPEKPGLRIVTLASGRQFGNATINNPNFFITASGVTPVAAGNISIYRIELPITNLGPPGLGTVHLWANGMETQATFALGQNEADVLFAELALPPNTPFDIRPTIIGHSFAVYRPPPPNTSHMRCELRAWSGGTFTDPSTGQPITGGTGGRFNVLLYNDAQQGPCYVRFFKSDQFIGAMSGLGWQQSGGVVVAIGERLWADFSCTSSEISARTATLTADSTQDQQGFGQHGGNIFSQAFTCSSVAPPPPPPPPGGVDETTGTLSVTTTPTGAGIILNDQFRGTSNAAFELLPGSYTLALTTPDPRFENFGPTPIQISCFFSTFQQRRICTDWFVSWNFQLKQGAIKATITDVRGREVDATVDILKDGALVGSCSTAGVFCQIPLGATLEGTNYTVRISSPGREPKQFTVTVHPNETAQIGTFLRNDLVAFARDVKRRFEENVQEGARFSAFGDVVICGAFVEFPPAAGICTGIVIGGKIVVGSLVGGVTAAAYKLGQTLFGSELISPRDIEYPTVDERNNRIVWHGIQALTAATLGAVALNDLEGVNQFLNKYRGKRLLLQVYLSNGPLPPGSEGNELMFTKRTVVALNIGDNLGEVFPVAVSQKFREILQSGVLSQFRRGEQILGIEGEVMAYLAFRHGFNVPATNIVTQLDFTKPDFKVTVPLNSPSAIDSRLRGNALALEAKGVSQFLQDRPDFAGDLARRLRDEARPQVRLSTVNGFGTVYFDIVTQQDKIQHTNSIWVAQFLPA